MNTYDLGCKLRSFLDKIDIKLKSPKLEIEKELNNFSKDLENDRISNEHYSIGWFLGFFIVSTEYFVEPRFFLNKENYPANFNYIKSWFLNKINFFYEILLNEAILWDFSLRIKNWEKQGLVSTKKNYITNEIFVIDETFNIISDISVVRKYYKVFMCYILSKIINHVIPDFLEKLIAKSRKVQKIKTEINWEELHEKILSFSFSEKFYKDIYKDIEINNISFINKLDIKQSISLMQEDFYCLNDKDLQILILLRALEKHKKILEEELLNIENALKPKILKLIWNGKPDELLKGFNYLRELPGKKSKPVLQMNENELQNFIYSNFEFQNEKIPNYSNEYSFLWNDSVNKLTVLLLELKRSYKINGTNEEIANWLLKFFPEASKGTFLKYLEGQKLKKYNLDKTKFN